MLKKWRESSRSSSLSPPLHFLSFHFLYFLSFLSFLRFFSFSFFSLFSFSFLLCSLPPPNRFPTQFLTPLNLMQRHALNTWLLLCHVPCSCMAHMTLLSHVSSTSSPLPLVGHCALMMSSVTLVWHVSSCHVPSNPCCLEKCEILTVSKFDKNRLDNLISRDEFNGEVHFVIRDLERFIGMQPVP